MTAAHPQLPPAIAPMPARRRFGIAAASSLAVHLLLLLLIGLLSGRAPLRPPVLIPIELMIAEAGADSLVLGASGRPEAPPKVVEAPAVSDEPPKEKPSSSGGKAKAAPAPPKLLTSKSGTEPTGAQGTGEAPAGDGGREQKPAGPTRGPNIVGSAKPLYPKDALDQRLEGTVTIAVLVADDGSTSSVTVADSSGHAKLDQAAKAAVERSWSFSPALENGKPVPGKRTITFVFTAGNGQTPPSVDIR